jgi:hypothetical protein
MSDFSIVNGVAEIHDPELYRTWLDRPDYIAALAASPDPGTAATKQVVIEFQAELGRMIRDRGVEERIRQIMERYVAEDYVYRATDGKLSEHWGAFRELAPGQVSM